MQIQTDSTPQPLPEWRANTGGPRSRTRSERLHASILGPNNGGFGCAFMRYAAVDFGRHSAVKLVLNLLKRQGIDDPEDLRLHYLVIKEPCLCRPSIDMFAPMVAEDNVDEVLRRVLILALSTEYLYDPARPVLLTETSLQRQLALYSGAGYYA